MKWMDIAQKYRNTKEIKGPKDNPTIVKMFSDVGFSGIKNDETAWCAAFTGAVLKEAGLPYLKTLTARDYLKYGKKLDQPKEGCIVVFWRNKRNGWQGHVGFVTLWDNDYVWCLGGNQRDTVNVMKFPRSRVLEFRWPPVVEKEYSEKEIEKDVVKKSTKLTFMQSIRRFILWIIATIGGVFSLDTLNIATSVVNDLQKIVTDNLVPISLSAIILFWFILKYIEWKQLGDYKEGRYIPSKMTEREGE